MRLEFSQFGNYVGVQQVTLHENSGGERRLRAPRSGTIFSKRGASASSKSLSLGLEADCSRRHSSMGTRTAVSTPRRVTTCGPFFSVASKNSLNRAFASCNCQTAISAASWPNDMTSLLTSQVRHSVGDAALLLTNRAGRNLLGR